MATITARLFVSHPVAAAQYVRVLSAENDIRLASGNGPYRVGLFDVEAALLPGTFLRARHQNPAMRPLLLTSSCAAEDCLRWRLEGFWGLVAYQRYEEELAPAVRQVAQGYLRFPASALAPPPLTVPARLPPAAGMSLTPRERQVLAFLLRGLSNKEIAAIFRVRERTAKFHVRNIFLKSGIHSRRELAANASLFSGKPEAPSVPAFRIRFSGPWPPD